MLSNGAVWSVSVLFILHLINEIHSFISTDFFIYIEMLLSTRPASSVLSRQQTYSIRFFSCIFCVLYLKSSNVINHISNGNIWKSDQTAGICHRSKAKKEQHISPILCTPAINL